MNSFLSSFGKSKQNKFVKLTTSTVAALALASGINAANATSIKTPTAKEVISASVQPGQTEPNISQLTNNKPQYQAMGLEPFALIPLILVGGFVISVPLIFGGLVVIGEREVGIVVKKFALTGKGLPAGRLIALNGEAGLQADTLAPGWHWGHWPWQYSIKKESIIVVPQGQIALIVAADGAQNPPERILGKIVECDNFQDARKFLTKGGEKGRQMGFLTAGSYRINTALFKVITAANASTHGMSAEQLNVYSVKSDKVGIVTTLDGLPISPGEIAGVVIEGHDNFQNGQKFINGGGRRGLQEQILLSGSWNLNPWFVQVEQVPMTEIPIGYVGVVISFVGQEQEDISGAAFTHGNLVHQGHKGVWVEPLYPGKHPTNSRIMKIELVPTTNIVLNWSGRTERHSYDEKLQSLTVRSRDGFAFDLEVAQIIHVGALDAPKVISRVGAMQNLVDHVLEPTIGNYFRNSAQNCTVLDFLTARSERQTEAAEFIKAALRAYDVQAIDTLIGDIQPPAALMQTQTDRKIAEEERKTYEVQQMAQTQRQQLVRETALANIQQEMVKSEQSVQIAELKAQAAIKEANGEAEATKLKSIAEADGIRATGNAKAETYRTGVQALGSQGYTAMQLMQIIGDRNVRLIPDVMVAGNNGNSNGLVDGLLSMILWNQTGKTHPETKMPVPPPPPLTKIEPNDQNNNSQLVVQSPVDK
ncbi:flotillin family protein [Anabaena cylindrica FACHB-243]|uniref:Band 7 protein n=1 Tax=Anabaena cylindrica (strain ATCC 27899 / PCC 7122) TaxID=272123 RepID=K9ZBY1_ANACC|nr:MULTISPECIES: flotillin family protein [Anabaena]AFZ56127.1 band 7 protein [Anabaena cylindrica PCC 7122]MBD2417358.1 flotillin family protein [Anabaena cylindrica FACHB-243]MBY5282807.1 flotillin family protein [Anabaena sp. CCAP 1446/1C]MBY5310774.1 flotillin family protein [Anabaena sp. CCAP 1446/1C]MCM2404439.1 flotillin family protein [Anabaena sp. CCAP 1446/1C]